MKRNPPGRTRQLMYISLAAAIFSLLSYSYKAVSEPGESALLSHSCSEGEIQRVDGSFCEPSNSPEDTVHLSSAD